jgi:hypothetical protein
VSYLGIHHVAEFVTQARARHAGDLHESFELGDFSSMICPRVDHGVGLRLAQLPQQQPNYVYGAIAKMLASAAQTMAFSVLDVTHFPYHPLLVGHPLDEIISFCRKLSPSVSLVRGDHLNAATVVMRTT